MTGEMPETAMRIRKYGSPDHAHRDEQQEPLRVMPWYSFESPLRSTAHVRAPERGLRFHRGPGRTMAALEEVFAPRARAA